MELNIKLLEQIMNVPSPTGYTKNAVKFLQDYFKTLGYDSYTTNKGNLVVEVKGQSDYTIGVSAHLDTLGLMVRSINSDGTIRFTPLGGPILNTYNAEYCTIYTRGGKSFRGTVLSTSPAAHVFPDAKSKVLGEETMCIRLDEVVYSKADVEKLGIQTGDFIAIDPKFEYTKSGFVKTRFLDDKASVFILAETLRYMKENNITPKNNLVYMFTTYEEVGHGCSYLPKCDELLAVDMGCIGLDLNCTEEQVSICVKDSSGPYDFDMTNKLIELAKKLNLNYALDIYPMYSSDGSAALRGGNNIRCALVGSGIAASHGMERTHIHGLNNTFKLVLEYITK